MVKDDRGGGNNTETLHIKHKIIRNGEKKLIFVCFICKDAYYAVLRMQTKLRRGAVAPWRKLLGSRYHVAVSES